MSTWIDVLYPHDGPKPKRITKGKLTGMLRLVVGDLRFNELTKRIEHQGRPLKNHEVEDLSIYLSEKGYVISDDAATKVALRVARERCYHPVEDYFRELEQDDSIQPHDMSQLATTYLGTTDPLYDEMWAATFRAGVHRMWNPGCQHDTVLVFQGRQGGGKTTTAKKMAIHPRWFSSSSHDQLKDQTLALHKVFITELAELEHITGKRSAGALKNFISTSTDLVRAPYGKSFEEMDRRSIMVASVNGREFLRDHTGERRFWVIELPPGRIDTDRLEKAMPSIWKGALMQCRAGMEGVLSAASQELSNRRNDAFHVENPYTSAVEEHCLGMLKAKPFTTRYAIEQSYVLADGQKPGTREFQIMSLCLEQLGFEKDPNPTADIGGKTRKWTFTGTGGTGSMQGSVPASKPGPDCDSPFFGTDTHRAV